MNNSSSLIIKRALSPNSRVPISNNSPKVKIRRFHPTQTYYHKQQIQKTYEKYHYLQTFCQHHRVKLLPFSHSPTKSIRNFYLSNLSGSNGKFNQNFRNDKSFSNYHKNIYKQLEKLKKINFEVEAEIKFANLEKFDLKNDVKVGSTVLESNKLGYDITFCQDTKGTRQNSN